MNVRSRSWYLRNARFPDQAHDGAPH
jgi:hypothetical protein